MRVSKDPRQAAGAALRSLIVAASLLLLAVPAVATPAAGTGAVTPTQGADEPAEATSVSVPDGERLLIEVTLAMPFVPEPALERSQGKAQRAEIGRLQGAVRRLLRGTDHDIVHEFSAIPALSVWVSGEALDRLAASELVAAIHEPIEVELATSADDVEVGAGPDGPTTSPMLLDSTVLVGSRAVNIAGWDGKGQVVAVIDTGVEAAHPFFNGRVVAEACFSFNGDCPDETTSMIGPGAGAPCSFSADCDHGTHVAGIVAGNNGSGLTGVAPAVDLIAINASSKTSGGLFSSADIAASLDHVFGLEGSYDIAAVNLSLGGGQFPGICDSTSTAYNNAVANLTAAGIAVVAASGNNGFTNAMSWPACQSETIAVGSSSLADAVSSFSNSSAELRLLAPGEGIRSATGADKYARYSGTSMAAPHVAGAFALLGQAFPAPGAAERITKRQKRLADNGVVVTDARQGRTTPRLEVLAAVLTGLPGNIPVPADYNGDGTTDIAFFRPSTGTWHVRNQFDITYGKNAGDIPLPADYNGNGKADIAIFRPSTGTWHVRNQFDITYGKNAGDIPLPADYNGNGKADIAIFRPSTGTWHVRNQFDITYG